MLVDDATDTIDDQEDTIAAFLAALKLAFYKESLSREVTTLEACRQHKYLCRCDESDVSTIDCPGYPFPTLPTPALVDADHVRLVDDVLGSPACVAKVLPVISEGLGVHKKCIACEQSVDDEDQPPKILHKPTSTKHDEEEPALALSNAFFPAMPNMQKVDADLAPMVEDQAVNSASANPPLSAEEGLEDRVVADQFSSPVTASVHADADEDEEESKHVAAYDNEAKALHHSVIATTPFVEAKGADDDKQRAASDQGFAPTHTFDAGTFLQMLLLPGFTGLATAAFKSDHNEDTSDIHVREDDEAAATLTSLAARLVTPEEELQITNLFSEMAFSVYVAVTKYVSHLLPKSQVVSPMAFLPPSFGRRGGIGTDRPQHTQLKWKTGFTNAADSRGFTNAADSRARIKMKNACSSSTLAFQMHQFLIDPG